METHQDTSGLDRIARNLRCAVIQVRNPALAELAQMFTDQVFNITRRVLNNSDDAREVTQEVFLSVLTTPPNETVTGATLTVWLMAVVRNRICDRQRKQLRTLRTAQLPAEPLVDNRCIDPTIAPENRDEINRVQAALAELPEDYRLAIEFHHIAGLTYEEIATVLNRPIGTVRSYLSRGLTQIRAGLTVSRPSPRPKRSKPQEPDVLPFPQLTDCASCPEEHGAVDARGCSEAAAEQAERP